MNSIYNWLKKLVKNLISITPDESWALSKISDWFVNYMPSLFGRNGYFVLNVVGLPP